MPDANRRHARKHEQDQPQATEPIEYLQQYDLGRLAFMPPTVAFMRSEDSAMKTSEATAMVEIRPMSANPIQMLCLVVISIFGIAEAHAQDISAGQKIAGTWCSNCHNIAPKVAAAREGVPSFSSIAQMNSTTEASLAAFLTTPHGKMPNLSLSRAEIRDVSAYILSLRK
jgi:mono/diheme cytochrome c family protein